MFTKKLTSLLLHLACGPKFMAIQSISGVAGHQPSDNIFEPDTVARHPPGYCLDFYDSYFGWQRAIYAVSAAAQVVGEPCILGWAMTAGNTAPVLTATTAPTALAPGEPIVVAKTAMVSGGYGWYITHGIAPVAGDSALAASAAAFIHAAGRIGATGVGDQVVGAKVLKTSSHTVTKANTIVDKGTYRIKVPNTDGLFIGMPITGSGMGASAKITHITPDNVVTVDVVATASGVVTITGTYTDSTVHWLTCFLQGPAAVI
jgi:hypothetical protein